MKVYVPYIQYGYEGNGDPLGVYTTPEKAQKRLDFLRKAFCEALDLPEDSGNLGKTYVYHTFELDIDDDTVHY